MFSAVVWSITPVMSRRSLGKGGREEGLVNFLGGSFGSSSGSGLLFLKKGSGGADIRSAQ